MPIARERRKDAMVMVLCLLIPAALWGCRLAARPGAAPPEVRPDSGPKKPPRRLENGQPSERALAELTLLGLKEKDADLLRSLLVTEKEYRDVLFPEFPVAQGNSTPEFHWFLLQQKSRAGIEQAIDSFGGADLELLEVVVTQGQTEYATYRILNKVELRVRDRRGGQEPRQLRVFGSVVVVDGDYKILSYRN